MKSKNVTGWIAVSLSTLFACLWAFWGSIENFHEGWYYESFWMNVGLMFLQYLGWSLAFIGLGVISLRWPKVGGICFVLCAVLVPVIGIRTFAAIFIFAIPLGLMGMLYWFGRPRPVLWAYRLVVGLPLLTMLGFGIEPVIRVAGRYDDGNYQARVVEGTGVKLMWAPEGPGWPAHSLDLKDGSWKDAMRICSHLTDDGRAVADTPQYIWRLPTADEAVRSLVRQGRNAGGVWDSLTHTPTYVTMPDKESPLWKVHSPIIYWWTSTQATDSTAYRVVYNGIVNTLPKKLRMGDLGFRAVRVIK